MAEDPFASSRRRIARAKTHIRDLHRRFNSFIARKPYRHVIKPHRDRVHQVHKLKARRQTLPRLFTDISTDAIENLRAALDHAVYPIAVKVGAKNLNKIYFPFCANARDLPSRINDSCPGFPKPIITLLESFKPYKGGDDTLWAINEICKISKHKSLTTVAFNITAVHTRQISGFGNLALPPIWDRTKNEFVLGWTRSDTNATYDAVLRFQVGLEDVQVVASKPLVGLLNEMARIVSSIVAGLEAESRRIKLFT